MILALRYLGPGKRGKKGASEAQTRKDLGEMAQLPGMSRPQPLPGSLKELIAKAEQLKQKHKGL